MEGKGCRLAFVEHANARVRKRERERGVERETRSSFENGLSDVVDVDGRSHWDVPNALRDIFTWKFCPLIHPDQRIGGRRRGSRNEIEYEL